MSEKTKANTQCALDYAFKRIGGKYKGRILFRLHMEGVMRYGELRKSILDITTKMLTQSLSDLEADGLIVRKEYNELPPKVEYSLSQSGNEFIPLIIQLFNWGREQLGEEYTETPYASENFIQKLKDL
ncbi:MAG: hypothetical protein RL662_987 [Bacteroidota bacterium]|jgi:DNA-binding HxlR family transcriptional regulator